jgi:hypothetical protein
MMNAVDLPSESSVDRARAFPFSTRVPAWSGGERLPERLQRVLEYLSGYDMGDVRVYYASPWPARVGARAFVLGREIHLSPGAEDALEHEAWHVVQQKRGTVHATGVARFDDTRLGVVGFNDDEVLELEAELMGRIARSFVMRRDAIPGGWTLRFSPIRRPVLQKHTTVMGVAYAPKELKSFTEAVLKNVGKSVEKVVDLHVILADILNEDLLFSNWDELEREVRVREVGYQAETAMRNLMKENGPKYAGWKEAVKEYTEKAAKTWAAESKLALDQRKTYASETDMSADVGRFEAEALGKADVITWGSASWTNAATSYALPMFQWLVGAREAPPRKMNCWESVLYALVVSKAAPKNYILWANASYGAHSDFTSKPINVLAGLMDCMDYFYWSQDTKAFPCPIKSKKARVPAKYYDKNFVTIPSDLVIPRGRVIMFGTGEHVAISTGKKRALEEEEAKARFGIEEGHGMLELDGVTGTIIETTIEDLFAHRPTYLAGLVVAPFPICPDTRKDKVAVPYVRPANEEAAAAAKKELVEQEYESTLASQLASVDAKFAKRLANSRNRIDALQKELDDASNPLSDEQRKQKSNTIENENSAIKKTQALVDGEKKSVEKKIEKEVMEEMKRRLLAEENIKYVEKALVNKYIDYGPMDPYRGLVKFPVPQK